MLPASLVGRTVPASACVPLLPAKFWMRPALALTPTFHRDDGEYVTPLDRKPAKMRVPNAREWAGEIRIGTPVRNEASASLPSPVTATTHWLHSSPVCR